MKEEKQKYICLRCKHVDYEPDRCESCESKTHTKKEKKIFAFLGQMGTPGHCYAAQVFKNGKAFLTIEPTSDEKDATAYAELITTMLNEKEQPPIKKKPPECGLNSCTFPKCECFLTSAFPRCYDLSNNTDSKPEPMVHESELRNCNNRLLSANSDITRLKNELSEQDALKKEIKELTAQRDELVIWKATSMTIWGPVYHAISKATDIKLGESYSKKIVEIIEKHISTL